jgi:hypothetical protein
VAEVKTRFPMVIYIFVMLFAVERFFVTPRLTNIPSVEGTYEALAHMLVGFLILVSFYDREQQLGPARVYGLLGWLLGGLELILFVVQKKLHG